MAVCSLEEGGLHPPPTSVQVQSSHPAGVEVGVEEVEAHSKRPEETLSLRGTALAYQVEAGVHPSPRVAAAVVAPFHLVAVAVGECLSLIREEAAAWELFHLDQEAEAAAGQLKGAPSVVTALEQKALEARRVQISQGETDGWRETQTRWGGPGPHPAAAAASQ